MPEQEKVPLTSTSCIVLQYLVPLGVSREPLIWRVLVQSIYSESPASLSPPGTPHQVPVLPCLLHLAPRRYLGPGEVPLCRQPGAQLPGRLRKPRPALNLDAISGSPPSAPRQLLPRGPSQPGEALGR